MSLLRRLTGGPRSLLVAGIVLLLLWWQPFYVSVTGLPWLLLKVASIFLVGCLVIRRLQPAPVTGSSGACWRP